MCRSTFATAKTLSVLPWLGTAGIPVHPGASRPLALAFRDAVDVHGTNGLGGAEHAGGVTEESQTNGVQAILNAAEAHAGQLVLVALGPLTILSMALTIRPKLVSPIPKLAVTCGTFKVHRNVTPQAEYNAFADPDAASQLTGACWNQLVVVGLDVTRQVALDWDQ